MEKKTTRFLLPEWDKEVSEQLKDIKRKLIIDAEIYARSNHPSLSATTMGGCFLENHNQIQALIHKNNEMIQSANRSIENLEHDKQTELEVRELQNDWAETKQQHHAKEEALKDQQPPYGKFRIPAVVAIICIVMLADGILNKQAFEAMGFPLLEALCMGLFVAGILGIAAHLYVPMVQYGDTLMKKRLIAAAIALVLIGFFIYMGKARADYLNANAGDTAPIHFSPLVFVVLSIILFGVATIISHKYFPTTEQRKVMRQYKPLLQERLKNEALQLQHKQAIKAKRQENMEINQANNSLQEYAATRERYLISQAHECLALWQKQNMAFRPDRGRPVAFENLEYPYSFVTYFSHITLMS